MERARFVGGFFSGDGFRLAGAGAGFRRRLPGAFVARLLGDKPLGNLGLPFIKFGVARAYKMQVAALERGEFGAQIRRAQLAIGKLGFERGLLFELKSKLLFFWFGRTRVRRLQGHGLRLCVSPATSAATDYIPIRRTTPETHLNCTMRAQPPRTGWQAQFPEVEIPAISRGCEAMRANLSL